MTRAGPWDGDFPSPNARKARGELVAGRNDRVGFFAVLMTAEVGLGRTTLALLTAEGDSTAISTFRAFRLHSVAPGPLPGWHLRTIPPHRRSSAIYDVLVPVEAPSGGLVQGVPSNTQVALWLEFDVPEGAAAGEHPARLELLSNGTRVAEVPIRLTVYPVRLPESGDIAAIAYVDDRKFQQAPPSDALTAACDALRRDGLSPVLPHLAPKTRVAANGMLEVDWTAYDLTVRPLMLAFAGSSPRSGPIWPLPTAPIADALRHPSGSGDRLARQYLKACIDHFAGEAWLDRSFAPLPLAYRPGEGEYTALFDRFSSMIRACDRSVAVLCEWTPQDLGPLGWDNYVPGPPSSAADIWCPPAQFFDRDILVGSEQGQRAWLQPDRPPFSGSLSYLAPPTQARVVPWQARYLGAKAIQLGSITDWPDGTPTVQACLQHNPGTLLYPGAPFGLDQPIPSLRLKMLREGLRDLVLCRALEENRRGHIAKALTHAIVGYCGAEAQRTSYADGRPNGWTDDWGTFESARSIMFAELAALQEKRAAGEANGELPTRAQFEWRALMSSGHRRLAIDGTRIRAGRPAEPAFQIESAAMFWNGSRSSWTARVGLDFPWVGFRSEPVTANVPPREFRRVRLLAQTPSIPWDHRERPRIFVEDDDGGRHQDLRVAFVSAAACRQPPRVDGDLADWPPGGANVASDFELITPASANEPSSRRPSLPSMAFVQRDEENLYIAVNCALAGPPPTAAWARNAVTLDDLVPLGDELVVLLFDPLNAGTRSPTDVYHITLKLRGPTSADRGVNVAPPLGFSEPWAVGFDSAVRTTGDRWCAEVRIPLSAFPVSLSRGDIWGFNVARFDAVNQELSSWSGAVGNVFDPLSLGNLYLP